MWGTVKHRMLKQVDILKDLLEENDTNRGYILHHKSVTSKLPRSFKNKSIPMLHLWSWLIAGNIYP